MTRQDPESFGARTGARAAVPATLPRLPGLDHTFALLRDGYGFIGRNCDALGVDGFRARLMLREALCLRGPEAAALLYGRSGLTRVGAMPASTLRLLQDKGSVQQLEGEAHRARKAMFIRLVMDPARIEALTSRFEIAFADIAPGSEISVLDHANRALTRAACHWIGLRLTDAEADRLTGPLFRMSDRSGHFGPGTLRALWERRGVERVLRAALRAEAPLDSPLAIMGRDLPPETAATELLNILRPVVAVGRYIAFAAKALHEYPMWCELFRRGNAEFMTDFCEEVRRISPFFPFTAAFTTDEVVWQGAVIPAKSWLLLDIHGTNHDARLFPAPDRFRPERMLDWQGQDDCFIPQGGGRVERSHRCPGEAATLALMVAAVRVLCCRMDYILPPQDLGVAMNRIPAQPASGVRIRVQRVS